MRHLKHQLASQIGMGVCVLLVAFMPVASAPQFPAPNHATYLNRIAARDANEDYAKAHHCLAQTIYFEARSEPHDGWEAVAEVVINRALDTRYPATICGVVFQNEYKRHRCQFSFACDGRSDRPKNKEVWQTALRIAADKLARYHVPPHHVRATHYHADYVAPSWSKKMQRLEKIGRHIFYAEQSRPRASF